MKDLFKTLVFLGCLFAATACGDSDADSCNMNGTLDEGEMCDGTDVGSETCMSATAGVMPDGVLGCNADCTLNTTKCTGSGAGGSTAGAGG